MEFYPSGITGVLCVLGDTISEETGMQVANLRQRIERRVPGVIEMIPAYASLLIRYDPEKTDYDKIVNNVKTLERDTGETTQETHRTVHIPVCYGGEYGPDLAFVAQHAGLTMEEVIRLHTEREYRIYMIGFLPGFPYLGGLDERLFTPRLDSPRTKIPAGSVGIGGKQTGIYPLESPGGWQLIGRTPLRLGQRGTELPYRTGDLIRFDPIAPEEFVRLEGRTEYGD